MQALSTRQQQMLKLMGIDVWNSRSQKGEDIAVSAPQPETVDLEKNVAEIIETNQQPVWALTQSGNLDSYCWYVIQRKADQDILQKKCDRLLDAILFSQDQTRPSVCILDANQIQLVKSNSPENSVESSLKEFLGTHQPKAIIMLGEQLAQALLNTEKPIATMRNEQYKYSEGGCQLFITHSLEHLLNHSSAKAELLQDLEKVHRHLS